MSKVPKIFRPEAQKLTFLKTPGVRGTPPPLTRTPSVYQTLPAHSTPGEMRTSLKRSKAVPHHFDPAFLVQLKASPPSGTQTRPPQPPPPPREPSRRAVRGVVLVAGDLPADLRGRHADGPRYAMADRTPPATGGRGGLVHLQKPVTSSLPPPPRGQSKMKSKSK